MGVGVGDGGLDGDGDGGGGGGRAGERGRATEMISYASVVFFSRNFLFQCPKLSPHLMSISVRFFGCTGFWKVNQLHDAVFLQFHGCITYPARILCLYLAGQLDR